MRSTRLRAASALLAIAAVVALAAPAGASAAGEPQITSAGIDATDRLLVNWTLAPGTTFEAVNFSSSAILDPLLEFEDFADIDNFAGFECGPPDKSCQGTATQTSYRENLRVSRDRRYFVLVTANRGDATTTSQLWVIDETKPLIPGEGKPSATPTNSPAPGAPYIAPAKGTLPTPAFTLLQPIPKTIAGFLRRGVRGRLTCPVAECYADLALDHGAKSLVLDGATARPGGRRTFVMRPTKALRARLRTRAHIRLDLTVDIVQPDRTETEVTRSISLRR